MFSHEAVSRVFWGTMSEQVWEMNTSGFGPETMIETTEGPVPIEWISTTHQVLTKDHGPQPILSIDQHILRPLDGAFVPLVIVTPDANIKPAPTHPLVLPPSHRIFLDGPDIELHFEMDAALCQCGFLVDGVQVKRMNSGQPVYKRQILTPAHEIINANGLWAETLAAAPGCSLVDLDTLSPDIFARLKLNNGAHELAHPCLDEWEGRLLARGHFTSKSWAIKDAA